MNIVSIDRLDPRAPSDWWKELVRRFVRPGDSLELRCWREETDTIASASRYGAPAEERTEVSIRGAVTDELLQELLTAEPTEISGYSAMTKYFTVNVRSPLCLFSSQHYGTQLYLELPRDEDAAFVRSLLAPLGDAFSVGVWRE